MIAALAALCSAAAIWTLLSPPAAVRRLVRLVKPPSRDPRERIRGWVETFREQRSRPDRWRTSVIELCDAMAAELSAGRTPDEAFRAAAAALDPHVAEELLRSSRSPPDRLDELAERPGAEGLRLLAACWRVGAERGGALATVLDGLASALRDEEAQRQDVSVQLAGPRATARLLALLPLLGVAMAAALGARPIPFLFGTLPGLVCLLTGTALNAAGLYWTRRLARAAESLHA